MTGTTCQTTVRWSANGHWDRANGRTRHNSYGEGDRAAHQSLLPGHNPTEACEQRFACTICEYHARLAIYDYDGVHKRVRCVAFCFFSEAYALEMVAGTNGILNVRRFRNVCAWSSNGSKLSHS